VEEEKSGGSRKEEAFNAADDGSGKRLFKKDCPYQRKLGGNWGRWEY